MIYQKWLFISVEVLFLRNALWPCIFHRSEGKKFLQEDNIFSNFISYLAFCLILSVEDRIEKFYAISAVDWVSTDL